jgi:DNA-binding MarR family transcriptional regulator
MAESLPLVAQLSAALTAFTIEADNEAERRAVHHTTDEGGPRGSVWLTSLAMWFNCLRELEDGPLTVAELERRARMSTNLDGMRRWGYITIDRTGRIPRGATRPKPKPGSVLALTERGRTAAEVWAPLPDEIERRWVDRFGTTTVEQLRTALVAIARESAGALPDFLPIGSVYGVGISDPEPRDDDEDLTMLPLISLLARVLLALALDYERGARLALALQLNGLRVLDNGGEGVAIRDLPARSGITKAAMAMIVGRLERVGCAVTEPIPDATRGRQARLTERGHRARAAGAARLERVHVRVRDGAPRLAAALEPIVGDGTRDGSPLYAGLHADGWRTRSPQPDLLPWFPMVLHRGGYPDGS